MQQSTFDAPSEGPSFSEVRKVDVPHLVCPTCALALTQPSEGTQRCGSGHTWQVVNGIPRFVASDNYAAAFGAQWIAFPRTQLDSYTGTTLSRDRAFRCIGPDALKAMQTSDAFKVLEVGCGAGRFTEVLLGAGAIVTSADLSLAVDANARNFPLSDSHRIVQADVRALPFDKGQFDLVFCLGVVQHTPDPEQTIAKLYEQVRPGGFLVIDHYPPGWTWYTTLKPVFRGILRRLPPERTLPLTKQIVDFFLPLHSRVRNSRLGRSLLARVSPVFCYFHDHPELSEAHQREWAWLDTHDALTDWYKHRRSKAQLTAVAQGLGARDIWCELGGNGVELRCRRPDSTT
jgi:SAM-dependent methyltransferase